VTASVQSSSGRAFRVDVHCDLESVREATRQFRVFLAGEGLTEAEQGSWELACMEAVTNGVEHVLPGCDGEPLRLCVVATDDEVEVSISDRTQGFDWPDDPDLPGSDSESGRGVYLISHLTDEASYLRGRRGNRLVMCRRREVRRQGTSSEVLEQQVRELDATLTTMTEELASCYESLTAIFRFTEDIKRGQRGTDLAAKWLSELVPVCGADWCVLRLVADDKRTLVTAGSTGPAAALPPLELDGYPVGSGPTEVRALKVGTDIWFDAESPLGPADPLLGMRRTDVGISHPIFYQGQPFGVLSAGRAADRAGLTAGQINVLYTFADFLCIQLRNLRLQEEYVRGQLVSRELQIAERIQRSLLPDVLPKTPGYGLAGYSQNANQVGGDFYDAIALADGSMLLVMADVMGKGVPAAMFAAILRSTLRARPDLAAWPQELMMWLNQRLYPDLDRVEMFVTIQLVYFDPQSGYCRIASAGHCPAVLASPGGGPAEIDIGGPPIGVVPGCEYRDEIFSLEPGALLLLYTDGVTDVQDPFGTPFGTERLNGFVAGAVARGLGAERASAELASTLTRFREGNPAFDDVTVLLLGRLAEPEPTPNASTDDHQDPDRR
jgi:serine phosphatase RsbU (regulator of sigma subunit)/anti-sigma regulatory factor (Ser/Thr protein kinase)